MVVSSVLAAPEALPPPDVLTHRRRRRNDAELAWRAGGLVASRFGQNDWVWCIESVHGQGDRVQVGTPLSQNGNKQTLEGNLGGEGNGSLVPATVFAVNRVATAPVIKRAGLPDFGVSFGALFCLDFGGHQDVGRIAAPPFAAAHPKKRGLAATRRLPK